MNKASFPFESTGFSSRLVFLALAAALTVALSASPALAQADQATEQEGESADVDQDFEATGGDENSNACQAIQGVANTGNAQNVIEIEQYLSFTDDFEFEEVGSSIEENPVNTTECDDEVNQAASAASVEEGYWTSNWFYDPWYGWVYQWSDGSWWYWDPNVWDYTLGQWGMYVLYPYAPFASWTTAASETAMGALSSAGSLTSLAVLAALGLVGTSALMFRHRRGG